MSKPKKCPPEGAADWLLTYGDCMTLLLCFFVFLYAVSDVSKAKTEAVMTAFSGIGLSTGGNTLSVGVLAELGNNVNSMPSMEKGKTLGNARKNAISMFQPEIKSKLVKITADERGLIISLAADAFFEPASAELNIEETREALQKVASFLSMEDMKDRKFRIEGHTDNTPTDPDSEWKSNWELSSARSVNVLHYLTEFGANERQFQVAGFADTVPLQNVDTPEGRAVNRRVDIVILSEGHL
jgi:chemotaxis protein MotB